MNKYNISTQSNVSIARVYIFNTWSKFLWWGDVYIHLFHATNNFASTLSQVVTAEAFLNSLLTFITMHPVALLNVTTTETGLSGRKHKTCQSANTLTEPLISPPTGTREQGSVYNSQ